jgi:hypothetical protein
MLILFFENISDALTLTLTGFISLLKIIHRSVLALLTFNPDHFNYLITASNDFYMHFITTDRLMCDLSMLISSANAELFSMSKSGNANIA